MDNGDKQLLQQIHTAVGRIEGHLPNLATKNDVTTRFATHVERYHLTPPRPSLLEGTRGAALKGGGIITLLSAVAYAILQACGYLPPF